MNPRESSAEVRVPYRYGRYGIPVKELRNFFLLIRIILSDCFVVLIVLSASYFPCRSKYLSFSSKRTHTTMSSIAPVDLSHQVEAGLPASTTELPDNEEPRKFVAPVPKTGCHRHYVLLVLFVAAMGAVGLSLGLTQSGSSPEAVPVESATASDTNTNTATDPATDTTMDWFPDESYSEPTIDTTDSSIIDYFPPVGVFDDMCHEAEAAPTDGSVVIGNAGHALRSDLPICHEDRGVVDGTLYTVTADQTGEFTAEFQAWYSHIDIVNFVSVYEGNCEEALTCVEGSYGFDGTTGRYTWNAIEGIEYKVVVHSTGPFALNVFAPTVDRGCLRAEMVVVDGDSAMGQAGFPVSDDVPVCQQEHGEAGGSWYTVTADEDGIFMGLFFAFYQHSGVDDFVSIYEGNCSGQITCVDGDYEFDGTYGYYTWNVAAGVEYKVLVHSVGAFGLRIVTL